jgi:quercetin dioxygenase-like cupin family protein
MDFQFPHTIENKIGEKIIFHSVESTPSGSKVIVESFCQPGSGPAMHVHFKQDEELTVLSGKLGYKLLGEEPKFAQPGETVKFPRGAAHRFWADGGEVLHCKGAVEPANSVVYFLTALYAAQNKSNSERPEAFDAAYLLTRYKSEYGMPELPGFVKNVIIPITYRIGRLLGKYRHFENAPKPLR